MPGSQRQLLGGKAQALQWGYSTLHQLFSQRWVASVWVQQRSGSSWALICHPLSLILLSPLTLTSLPSLTPENACHPAVITLPSTGSNKLCTVRIRLSVGAGTMQAGACAELNGECHGMPYGTFVSVNTRRRLVLVQLDQVQSLPFLFSISWHVDKVLDFLGHTISFLTIDKANCTSGGAVSYNPMALLMVPMDLLTALKFPQYSWRLFMAHQWTAALQLDITGWTGSQL